MVRFLRIQTFYSLTVTTGCPVTRIPLWTRCVRSTPKVLEHRPDSGSIAQVESGAGYYGLNYPGAINSEGTAGYRRFGRADEQGGYRYAGEVDLMQVVTMSECRRICNDRMLVGAMHCMWLSEWPGSLTGDCGIFLAARSSQQVTLWKSFFRYFQHVTNLAHIDGIDVQGMEHTLQIPPTENLPCGPGHDVCMWCAF